jgi:FkbM family methyltransferase
LQPCFSWEGEDIVANKILIDTLGVENGYYLDIGAHHPFNLSNTAYFYRKGWRGLNVDAMPGAMNEFMVHRPEDTNIEAGVSDEPGQLLFTIFTDPGLNGFLSDEDVKTHVDRGQVVVERKTIECRTINDIIETHAKQPIDLMSIDVEGLDYRIIRSMAEKHRPKMIITETLGYPDVVSVLSSPIYGLMTSRDYSFVSRLDFSCIFIDKHARR